MLFIPDLLTATPPSSMITYGECTEDFSLESFDNQFHNASEEHDKLYYLYAYKQISDDTRIDHDEKIIYKKKIVDGEEVYEKTTITEDYECKLDSSGHICDILNDKKHIKTVQVKQIGNETDISLSNYYANGIFTPVNTKKKDGLENVFYQASLDESLFSIGSDGVVKENYKSVRMDLQEENTDGVKTLCNKMFRHNLQDMLNQV